MELAAKTEYRASSFTRSSSERRLSAITDLTENAASLRASYTASLPCRPNSIVVDQTSHPSTPVLSCRPEHLDRATSKAESRRNQKQQTASILTGSPD